jgi:hypothetical protein
MVFYMLGYKRIENVKRIITGNSMADKVYEDIFEAKGIKTKNQLKKVHFRELLRK